MITIIIRATLQGNDPLKTRSVRAGAGATHNYIGAIAPGTVFYGIRKHVIERDGEVDVYSKKGDVWWYCENVTVKEDKTPRSGYVAETHKGEVLLKVTLDQPDPTPTPTPTPDPTPTPTGRKIVSVVLTYDDGSVEKLV